MKHMKLVMVTGVLILHSHWQAVEIQRGTGRR